jgi:peptidoglycan/xylan/chitin deacetylase (PgdA/CDA1 family)
VIIQPNQRRRKRLVRISAGIVSVVVITSAATWAWRMRPDESSVPESTAVAAVPTPTVVPSPTAPPPSPSPIPSFIGCAPAPAELVPVIVASHGPRTKKIVALTFDDGTSAESTLKILATLVREHAGATFFPTGRSVERFADVWRRVAAAGYPIGNHTYSHGSLTGQCYEAQRAELLRDERVLGGLGLSLIPVMRPPYEEWDASTLLAARAAGESHMVLWDVDTHDWTGVNARTIVSRAVGGQAGSIVLMHTITNTADALPTIIHRYRDRGFTFVTVPTLLDIASPESTPQVSATGEAATPPPR